MEEVELLLGSLCPENLETTAEGLASKKSGMDESEFFDVVGKRIVALALAPEAPSTLYVQLVLELQTRISEKSVKKSLVAAVQAEYELIWNRNTVNYIGCDDEDSQVQPQITPEHKAHWIAFMEFLGLLYVNGLVAEVVIRSVLDKFAELNGSPDDNLVEGECRLLLTDGVIGKLFSTTRGETFLTQWKGLKCLNEYAKKKTRYRDLKSSFEAVTTLIENRGKVSKTKQVKSPSHGAQPHPQPDVLFGLPKSKFASLGESESPSHGISEGKDSPFADSGNRREKGNHYRRNEKGGEKGEKGGGKASDQPDPKQVFVAGAGIGLSTEDEIKTFFQQAGDVARVKVLRTPEGDSKDVCFITFRNEDQAQAAIALNGSAFAGRSLLVRMANGKKGAEKGTGGKGDRLDKGGSPLQGYSESPEFGVGSRFDALSSRSPPERDDVSAISASAKGKGKTGKGKQGKGEWLSELDAVLEEALQQDYDGPVKVSDFDFNAKRFLSELRSRDRIDGTTRFDKAIDMVLENTSGKDRDSVRRWAAYVFTLLQKFDPDFAEEFKRRDAERRRERNAQGRDEDHVGYGHDETIHESL